MEATDSPDCPLLEELAGLADERLDPQREAELIAHLDRCENCRERLEAVAADADLRAAARAAGEQSQARSKALDKAIDLLKVSPPNGPAAVRDSSCPFADLVPWIEAAPTGVGRVGGYRLTRFLGRGSMGLVFAGREETLDRPVAVKFLAPALASRAEFRERFSREARAIAAVNHPNVVTILAVAQTQGLPYLVMERVEGLSLAALPIRRRDAAQAGTGVDRIVRIARQLAAGLQAAHTAGLLHQDIKPANILISADASVVKLTDFGLARPLAEASAEQCAGTPGYVSPEVLAGEKPDPRSDLFALGCVLSELLAGHPPFPPREAAVPLATAAPDAPRWLAELVDRLLAIDPAARYQSAAEVERALAAGAAAAGPMSQPARSTAAAGLGRRRLLLGGLAAALATAFGLWLLRGVDPATAVTAASLAKAIRTAPSGAVITIPGDHRFELGSLDLGDRDLTIRGDGSRPVLRFVAGGEAAGQALFRGEGDLVLEGLSLELAMGPETPLDEAYCLIGLDGGSLRLEDCTLEVAGKSTCIIAVDANRLMIEASGLHAPQGTAIDWTPAAGSGAWASRSIISGRTGWAIADPLGATLRLDHVTAVVDRLITLRWEELNSPADSRLAVDVRSSVFAASEALLLLHTDAIAEAALDAAVAVEGRDNLFDAEVVMLDGENGLQLPDWLAGNAPGARSASLPGEEWLACEIPFAASREALRDWPESAAGDPAEAFAIRPDPDLRNRFGAYPPGGVSGWQPPASLPGERPGVHE